MRGGRVERRATRGGFTPTRGKQHSGVEAELDGGGEVTLVFEGVPPSLEAEGYDVAVEVVALTSNPVCIWHVQLPSFGDSEIVLLACRLALACVGVEAAELPVDLLMEVVP